MGIDVGPAPTTTDDVLAVYYRSGRAIDSYWEIGARAWQQVLQLKDGNGRSLATPSTMLLGYRVRIVDDADALRLVRPGAVTGPTERLPRVCRECADVLPDTAAFCVVCGAPV